MQRWSAAALVICQVLGGRYDVDSGVSAFVSNLQFASSPLAKYSLAFFTAVWSYWEELKA